MSRDISDPSLPKFVYLDTVFPWKCYDTPRRKYTEAKDYVLYAILVKSGTKNIIFSIVIMLNFPFYAGGDR